MQTAFKALTLEQRDEVSELLDMPGWRSLVLLVEGLAKEQEDKVISLAVTDGESKVIHQKLRAEGARSLAKDLNQFPQFIRKLSKG